MSEGANVRQNLQHVPSIFEITAAESLDNLIYPALNKLLDYFGLYLDFKLWGGQRVYEELSPLITWILQYVYLRKRSASFGESFYGLQRTDTTTGKLLTRRNKFISASLLTLMPYIELKLKTRTVQHQDTHKLERYILKAYHAYYASKAIHTFLYLIKYATSHSPTFRALHLTLRYPTQPPNEDKASYVFLKLLEVLAFFLQFIQWWYSNDRRRKLGGSLKNPAPLQRTVDQVQQYQLPPVGHCPVCLMSLATPTACAVTGYVYCWRCIVTHLKQSSTCPVTRLPITMNDLIRIYET